MPAERRTGRARLRGSGCAPQSVLRLRRCAVRRRPARPEAGNDNLPCVVMGRGGSGTRRLGLPKYAKAFSARAMTAPALDYRNFGASDGEARQAVIVAEQHDAAGRRYGLCARWRADPRRRVPCGCSEGVQFPVGRRRSRIGPRRWTPRVDHNATRCWPPSIELVLEGLMFYGSGRAGILRRIQLVVIAGGAVGAI